MRERLGHEFVTDWNKNELYLNRAKEAIDSIKDMDARSKVTSLQEDLFNHVKSKDTDKADEIFEELKEIAQEQTERLGEATAIVLFNYRFRDNGHRFREIEGIEDIPAAKQVDVDGETPEERVELLLATADWKETEFQDKMTSEIIDPMNTASSIKDLCEKYGIDSSEYVYDKFGNSVELIDPLFAFGNGTEKHILVKPRFGPPKSYQRTLAKEKEGIEKSGADKWIGLRDLNRVTLEFEDPLMLTLAYKALLKKFKISGLKNKFEWIHTDTYKQPPDIHMNLDLGDGWLVEVQLMFASILTIKKELHKYYDIVRAKNPRTILSPVFKTAKTNESLKDEEYEKLKTIIECNKEMDVQNQNFASMNVDGGGNGGENKRLREENESVKSENKRLKTFIREKMIDEANEILGEFEEEEFEEEEFGE
ncbi:hypothetical protein TrST_g3338 [Triparma strigata]|nr:hypothetical protein TrST_g3338 [Triparma strigata]